MDFLSKMSAAVDSVLPVEYNPALILDRSLQPLRPWQIVALVLVGVSLSRRICRAVATLHRKYTVQYSRVQVLMMFPFNQQRKLSMSIKSNDVSSREKVATCTLLNHMIG
jgi:hypothetical protein